MKEAREKDHVIGKPEQAINAKGGSTYLYQNRTISHISAVLSICPVDSRAILHDL